MPGATARFSRRLRGLKDAIAASLSVGSTDGTLLGDAGRDSVDALIALQCADGSWNLERQFAAVLGRRLAALTHALTALNLASTESQRVWATALAVTFLRTHAPERQDEWRLLVDKAERWLQSVLTDKARHDAVWQVAREEVASQTMPGIP